MSTPLSDADLIASAMQFHRPAHPDRQFVEVRLMLPIEDCRVVDAECSNLAAHGKPVDRQAMVRRIVNAWAVETHRKASVIMAVVNGNPPVVERE